MRWKGSVCNLGVEVSDRIGQEMALAAEAMDLHSEALGKEPVERNPVRRDVVRYEGNRHN
jgi:hypothetical protein